MHKLIGCLVALVGVDRTAAEGAGRHGSPFRREDGSPENIGADPRARGDAHRTCQFQFRPHDRRHSHPEGRTERARGPSNWWRNKSRGRGQGSRHWRRAG